jgi:hypothetical protein
MSPTPRSREAKRYRRCGTSTSAKCVTPSPILKLTGLPTPLSKDHDGDDDHGRDDEGGTYESDGAERSVHRVDRDGALNGHPCIVLITERRAET